MDPISCLTCGAEIPADGICLNCHPKVSPLPQTEASTPILTASPEVVTVDESPSAPNSEFRDSDSVVNQSQPGEQESPTQSDLENNSQPAMAQSQDEPVEDVPLVQCPKCGIEIPATMECPMCSLAAMETTRCPKCHNEMPVLGECSICRDNDARTKQFAAQREAAQKEKEAREARKTKRLKSLLENQTPTWENAIKNYRTAQIPLSKWQIAGICVVMVILFSGLSYWLTLYVQQNQAPANPSAEAIQLVSQSKARDASTIDQYFTVQMEDLAAKGSLDQIDGWWCEGAASARMKVKFMYRTKGGKEEVAEWTVDLNSKAIRPENELARKISP